MYRTCLTLARPPQTVGGEARRRCPRILPLSRLIGATPTRLAIVCLRFKVPSSGDREADIHFPAGGNDSVGLEAAVGPHRELSPGPAVAHPPHRLTQEVGGATGGVGPALAQDLADAWDALEQVVAHSPEGATLANGIPKAVIQLGQLLLQPGDVPRRPRCRARVAGRSRPDAFEENRLSRGRKAGSSPAVSIVTTCRRRPPQTVRCPRILPLSRLIGATPTRLAICLRFKVPSSGSSANRVTDRTWPTPGTLLSRSSRIRQRGLWRMVSPRPSSSLVSSFSNACASASGRGRARGRVGSPDRNEQGPEHPGGPFWPAGLRPWRSHAHGAG